MKRYYKANPTVRTQEKIIKVVKESNKPVSLKRISELAKTGFNETKTSIAFLQKLGYVELIVSSGNSTFVILKKTGALQNVAN